MNNNQTNLTNTENTQTNNLTYNKDQKNEAYYRYKAMKYHMKIQQKLQTDYVAKGIAVPSGYEQYLKPFEG